MHRNLLLYQRAVFFRKRKGYTYREIQEVVPVAKSTLCLWLRMIELTDAQKARIKQKRYAWTGGYDLGEWNRLKRQREIEKIRSEAKQEVGEMTKDQFFVAGVMLYWAEGNKSGKEVRASNADPIFIRFMMRWFRECCHIPEDLFRGSVHYHEGQNELEICKYWSQVSGIPLGRFYKSFCKPPGTGHRKHILQHGVMQIRLRKSADLLHRITSWREGLIAGIISGKPSE